MLRTVALPQTGRTLVGVTTEAPWSKTLLDDARAATLDETPVMEVQEDTAIASELRKWTRHKTDTGKMMMKQRESQKKKRKTRQRLPKWECVINGNDRQRASDKPRARATTMGKSLAYPEIRQTRSKVRIRYKQRPLDAAARHHMDRRTDCRTDRCHPNTIRFLIRYHPVFIHRDAIVPAHPAWVTQHPPVHHPKNPVPGFHGLDEKLSLTRSASFFFSFRALFFYSRFFFFPILHYYYFNLLGLSALLHYFFLGQFFFNHVFLVPPLTPIFWESPTSPLQPTYYPSSYQPTYLLHDTHLLLHSPTLLKFENKGEL